MAKPTLIDSTPYEAAGIIPPQVKKGSSKTEDDWRKVAVTKQLRILDMQDAVNRYLWKNNPCDLTSSELERLLYYRGQVCVFYSPPTQRWYAMPFALSGGIDFYGRFRTVHPVPISSGIEGENAKQIAAQREYLSTLKLDVLYSIPLEDEIPKWKEKFLEGTACVIVQDYTRQLDFSVISRQTLNDPLLKIMADCIPFMRTNLLASTGVKGMRVSNEMDAPNVLDANKALEKAAIVGDMYVPIVGAIDFQELTEKGAAKSEEFMLALQSLDNYRLSLYGLDTGGVFQKKSHMLQDEQEMNEQKGKSALIDGLVIRQNACNILNAVCELGVSCDINETAPNDKEIVEEDTTEYLMEEDENVSTDE